MGVSIPLASSEDTILSKLRWSALSGGSAQQQNDVRHIARFQKESLEYDYMREQAAVIGAQQALEEVIDDVQRGA